MRSANKPPRQVLKHTYGVDTAKAAAAATAVGVRSLASGDSYPPGCAAHQHLLSFPLPQDEQEPEPLPLLDGRAAVLYICNGGDGGSMILQIIHNFSNITMRL